MTASRHQLQFAVNAEGAALPVQLELFDVTPLRVLPPEPYDPRYDDICRCAGSYRTRE